MTMAGIVPRSRPSVSPKIRGVDDEHSSDEMRREVKDIKEKDLIRDRSPLADMLYLRCECTWVTARTHSLILKGSMV